MVTERQVRTAYGLIPRTWFDKFREKTECRIFGHVWFGDSEDPTQPDDPFCGSCLVRFDDVWPGW